MIRIFFIILFSSIVLTASAEPPRLDFIYPAGGEIGTTVTLKFGGKLDPWPAKFWTNAPGLTFEPQADKGVVKLQISDAATTGSHLVRIYNEEGASRARTILIGGLAEIIETDKNDDYRTPQKIEKLPVLVNGQLERPGDADSFAIDLKAGQWLVAKAEAYGIGSPVDPTLHLRAPDGHRITEGLDSENLDPLLTYRAPKEGTYILQLDAFAHPPRFDVSLYGTDAAVYRLSIFSGPVARYTFPLAVQRGTTASLALRGWNMESEGLPLQVNVDAVSPPKHAGRLRVPTSLAQNQLSVMLSDCAQTTEIEPNDSIEKGQAIQHPVGVSGHIGAADDRDFFLLALKKEEPVKFTVHSATLGFPLDAVISIWSPQGKKLIESDDDGAAWDPALNWKAPEDGTYAVQITDRFSQGGSDFAYIMEIAAPAPRVEGIVEKDTMRIDSGTTAALKIKVLPLDGFDVPVIAAAVDLPEGVTATSASVPAKGGDAALVFTASADAKPFSGLFRVLLLSTEPDRASATTAAASLDQELPVGPQIIQKTEQLWLTVAPPPPPKPAEEPKK